jgi:hypothetical protein
MCRILPPERTMVDFEIATCLLFGDYEPFWVIFVINTCNLLTNCKSVGFNW